MEWLYKAIEEYSYITIRSVLSKVLAILLMFLFVRSSNDYIIYQCLSIISLIQFLCENQNVAELALGFTLALAIFESIAAISEGIMKLQKK